MKEFFKTLLAVIFGLVIFSGIGLLIIIGIAATAGKEKPVSVKSNSVLVLDMNYEMPEKSTQNGFSATNLDEFGSKIVGLTDVLKSIQKAKEDKDIKGIYIPLGEDPNGMATNEAVRNALKDFKKSGKFVISYGDVATQKSYYLASVSDKIYMNPQGGMELVGFGTRMMFFKNTLDKMGVQVQAFHRGKFKSAFDPLVRTDISPENRQQITELLNDIYQHFLDEVSAQRKVNRADLAIYIDSLMIQNPKDAVRLKLIDGNRYYDQVLAEISEKSGLKSDEEPNLLKMKDYVNSWTEKESADLSGNKIAVIYASGNIVDGKGDDDNIGGDNYAKIIRKLRQDDKVKAIVLRVNSGGGSALASEVIWREVTLAKQKKPFIVSFGDVAASGGYYISCNADRIFAQTNSITGSIGVFGLIPSMQTLLTDKMGVTFDEVRINKHSVMGGGVRPLDDFESAVIQRSIDSVYGTFLSRVADGRKRSFAEIEEKAEGRVWSGKAALRIGLVDQIGGLDDAIAYAASKAEVDKYRVSSYPQEKDILDKILEGMNGESQTKYLEKEYGINLKALKEIKAVMDGGKIQARLPFLINVY